MVLEDLRYDYKREILKIKYSQPNGIIQVVGVSRELAKIEGIFDFDKFVKLYKL